MANTFKTGSAAKLVYTLGTENGKALTKSKTISNININSTDENVYEFALAMTLLQSIPCTISRIDTSSLTA